MNTQQLSYHVEPNNGSGWYWELISPDRAVLARGLADTEQQARLDAMRASMYLEQISPRLDGG